MNLLLQGKYGRKIFQRFHSLIEEGVAAVSSLTYFSGPRVNFPLLLQEANDDHLLLKLVSGCDTC
jgi:hypothetical protein